MLLFFIISFQFFSQISQFYQSNSFASFQLDMPRSKKYFSIRKSQHCLLNKIYNNHCKKLSGKNLWDTIRKEIPENINKNLNNRQLKYYCQIICKERKHERECVKAPKTYSLLLKYFKRAEAENCFINDFILMCRAKDFFGRNW